MQTYRRTSGLAFGAVLLAWSAQAAAEFDAAALAATHAAMAGTWEGTETLNEVENDISMTIAITGDGGLNQALWGRDFLVLLDLTEGGGCVFQHIGPVGPVGIPRLGRWVEVQAPDADGNWTRTAAFESPPGFPAIWHRYEMTGDELRFVGEAHYANGEVLTFWKLNLRRAG